MEHFRRKTPEEILLSISKLHQGRLKVYIGSVSGSGKTYHMLREGQSLKTQGIDVVISAVSTMQRPETIEQIGDLERVPSIHWWKDGIEKKDLDIDALIKRNPEVVIVDGLAHRNREDAPLKTRLEDIQRLIRHGMSVITTINVYELEDVRSVVQKLTKIEVVETVPTDTLSLADEVVLIDVTPETMLNRVAEGKLLSLDDMGIFKRGNLAILRELTLRLVAEGVNDSLEKYREEWGLIGPSGAGERILVSTQYHWNGSIYMRRGQQIAKRLNGELLIVTFVNKDKELTREAAVFKRSQLKLANRIGAEFTELPLCARRELPKVLVNYALTNNVTRILLGHSKQTWWQEFWHGSIVHDMLKRTRNVDIFIVADRAEHDGERILPTKVAKSEEEVDLFRRLSSQEMVQKIEQIKRGTFQVFIGSAPGVGKTFTMLREGNHLLKKGIDVCIGLLETHGRKETQAQINELEILPRKVIEYRGTHLDEMDTAGIIRRNPEVVLVDELAHTNVPGSQYKKRYEDVLEILAAGISVITTVNVQHLESLNDAVEQITGVRVRETIPDHILRLADEVQLIDVTPESLQQRMKDGKIYNVEKIHQALNNFFRTGNLIALRELALREIADDVDERLESWERNESLRGPWRRQEVIYVCLNKTQHAERLIRRGFRIAYRLKAIWYVTFVQLERTHNTTVMTEQLEALRKLTERLGGKFEILTTSKQKHIPMVLVSKANGYQATQMIIGQSKTRLWKEGWQGSIIKKILRATRHLDVLVVADFEPLN
ncbi:two-component system sensor histidine kinase KdpD [Paenibacillus sp. DS2015]|uniref:histidine kinase n=1 Tax=Paenibacillus sp. DS2015 TaxID=3373917 RepID=UPI003D21C8E0